MSHIICMDSKEFLKKFIKKYNHKKYTFFLISEDVKTSGDYDNVYLLKALIPPPNVVSEFVNKGYSKKYKEKYLQYLTMPKVEMFLTIIVKFAVMDKRDVVLLCSDNETQYKYLKLISVYLENVYNVNTCSYSEYDKNPEKSVAYKSKKQVLKILEKKLSNIKASDMKTSVNLKVFKKRLQSLSKKELKSYCKERGISIKKDDDKDDIIKRILKTLK